MQLTHRLTQSHYSSRAFRFSLLATVLGGMLTWLTPGGAMAADTAAAATPPADKAKFQLFLLVGQSNMAGRGTIDPAKNSVHPRVWMLSKDNQWVPAKDPVHFDKPAVVGVGLSPTFAKTIAEANPDIHIGLIPCAVGGTTIEQWAPDKPLFKNAVVRAAKAMESGTLTGILWHQGESNSEKGLSKNYAPQFVQLINTFRTTLKAPDVPFIAGELGTWNQSEDAKAVNACLHAQLGVIPRYGLVSSKDLQQKPADKPHFDAESLREFGRRYAAEFLRVQAGK